MNLLVPVLDLEALLIGTCEALKLSLKMQKEAENYYYEAAEFLSEDPFLAQAHRASYPQGSLRMAVTVKPYKKMNLIWILYLS